MIMSSIRCVHIGNLALPEKNTVCSLKSYAGFYNELAGCKKLSKVSVFAGYILPGETGFEFSNEKRLCDNIDIVLSKGNTPTTNLVPFIKNNLILFVKLISYCLKKSDYFIFLPSPIGVLSVLTVSMLNRKRSLGIYLGGYYKNEQAFEQRSGALKKTIKKAAASLVEKLVLYSIKKADYIITPSYELYQSFKSTGKMFLAPPMINVDEQDLALSLPRDEKFITFCGELRHAKGIVDLMKAFIILVKERRIEECRLKIIGSGQAYEELLALASASGIEDKVIFCGQIKDKTELKKAIGTSTIFVLPSYSEGFPRVAYECFTLGVPTILTPVGGIPFFVSHKIHCLLTQPGNITELATNIEQLVKDEALQVALSEKAKHLMADSVFPRIKADVSLANIVFQKIKNMAGV